MGNLRTAWISERWARKLGQPWVVRFEDIDRPRVLSGAQELQLADMKSLGLIPDLVLLQSTFEKRHWDLFLRAVRAGQVYPCDCSRKEVQSALAGLASAPHDGRAPLYSGRCRSLVSKLEVSAATSFAWRFKMPEASGADDFIVARTSTKLTGDGTPDPASFVPAYHWACAIDDFDGRYEVLVRSWDLQPALELQRAICKWIDPASVPSAVFHTSLVVQNDGRRLEKRTMGVTLRELEQAGHGTKEILGMFETSFDDRCILSPASLNEAHGEVERQLTLDRLGLKGQ